MFRDKNVLKDVHSVSVLKVTVTEHCKNQLGQNWWKLSMGDTQRESVHRDRGQSSPIAKGPPLKMKYGRALCIQNVCMCVIKGSEGAYCRREGVVRSVGILRMGLCVCRHSHPLLRLNSKTQTVKQEAEHVWAIKGACGDTHTGPNWAAGFRVQTQNLWEHSRFPSDDMCNMRHPQLMEIKHI